MTHAAIDQTETEKKISLIEDEYISYAISLDFLSEARRNILLSERGFQQPVHRTDFDELSYGLDPTGFGLLAWLHFSAPGTASHSRFQG